MVTMNEIKRTEMIKVDHLGIKDNSDMRDSFPAIQKSLYGKIIMKKLWY